MTEILVTAAGVLVYGALVGFLPGFMLRPLLWIYPKGSDRPEEILGELYNLPFRKRIPWAFQQMEVAVFEGGKQRLHARRDRREQQRENRRNKPGTDLPSLDPLAVSFAKALGKGEEKYTVARNGDKLGVLRGDEEIIAFRIVSDE